MLPSGTTVKDKALLSNSALIYLPPCSLGPTVGLERYFSVVVWSYNREDAAYLTAHSYTTVENCRKLFTAEHIQFCKDDTIVKGKMIKK